MSNRVTPRSRNRFTTAVVMLYLQQYPGKISVSGIVGVPYELQIEGKVVKKGKTYKGGIVALMFDPAKTVHLQMLGSTYEISVRKDKMEPQSDIKGVQRRLNMLGYNAGAVTGVVNNNVSWETDRAILNFQADNKMRTDGIPGSRTQKRLRKLVGE